MNPALLAACLAMASLPPVALRLAPREDAPADVASEPASPAAPGTAPDAPGGEPPSAAEPAGPIEPEPEPTSDPEPTPEAEPEPEPDAGPPTTPATIAPTTLPSPGDIDPDSADDEPLADEAYDPMTDSPEALQARHWVRTGVALLAVGSALTITAAVFGGTDPCRRGIGNSCQDAAARRAALAIGIPGGLMLVGGATSLAIGIVRRNQLRASVAVSRDAALVGVSGRF